jgi:hypothetical protein
MAGRRRRPAGQWLLLVLAIVFYILYKGALKLGGKEAGEAASDAGPWWEELVVLAVLAAMVAGVVGYAWAHRVNLRRLREAGFRKVRRGHEGTFRTVTVRLERPRKGFLWGLLDHRTWVWSAPVAGSEGMVATASLGSEGPEGLESNDTPWYDFIDPDSSFVRSWPLGLRLDLRGGRLEASTKKALIRHDAAAVAAWLAEGVRNLESLLRRPG